MKKIIDYKDFRLEESVVIDEMAKGIDPGHIYRVNTVHNLGISNSGHDWSKLVPKKKDNDGGEGYFYFEVKKSGAKWIEGPILYANCLSSYSEGGDGRYRTGWENYEVHDIIGKWIRVHKSDCSEKGKEFDIFQKDREEINKAVKKVFFLDKEDSDKVIDMKGEKVEDVQEGEYRVRSLNFELSQKLGKTVVFLVKKGAKDGNGFCAELEKLTGMTKELGTEQREVIAEWVGKKIGAEIDLDRSNNDNFKINTYEIKSPKSGNYVSEFECGPFTTKKQADDALEVLKKLEYPPFDVENLSVSKKTGWNDAIKVNLEGLVSFARTCGLETTIRDLMVLKRGAVTGKRLGI